MISSIFKINHLITEDIRNTIYIKDILQLLVLLLLMFVIATKIAHEHCTNQRF